MARVDKGHPRTHERVYKVKGSNGDKLVESNMGANHARRLYERGGHKAKSVKWAGS